MACKSELKNNILNLICAGLIFTILSVSYIVVPDNANYTAPSQNIDCTGSIA